MESYHSLTSKGICYRKVTYEMETNALTMLENDTRSLNTIGKWYSKKTYEDSTYI